MAEIQLTVNRPTSAGIAPTVQTGVDIGTTDQYFIPASRRAIVRVSNGAGAVDMTIVSPLTVDGLAVADRTVNIPANATRYFGNLNPEVYGNEGRIQFTFSAADANIVLEVVEL